MTAQCHSKLLAGFATVSREWQTVIERHNFARIKLTSSRLADFSSIIHRNRALVRYIWLCLELEEYDCRECAPRVQELMGISNEDNTLITTAFLDLFSILSAWAPNGNLQLDISVHSPSDSEHWFKYLTFGPDTPSDECDRDICAEQSMLVKLDDHKHDWPTGPRIRRQDLAPLRAGILKVFDRIMGEGPFVDDEQENQWWQQLPLVPVVTGVLLRQQTRRRWKPTALAQMFARLPRLQEIHYEPWRPWTENDQRWTDESFQSLLESLDSSRLWRLVLFEDFNLQYPLVFINTLDYGEPCRIPTPDVNRAVAKASLELEHLSASYIKWPSLTSLTLTSQLLSPHACPVKIDNMLRAAAAAAMKMPNLETVEIWNGHRGWAMLFRYQLHRGRPVVITRRGTEEFALRPPVVQAWEAVALKRGLGSTIVVEELLDAGTVIRSHGDAIHHLKLLNPVIRPASLRQIRMEHRIRKEI
ncbi:hypothetical protein BJX99DRAFT_245588 [Aspergillus californicus]